MNARTLALLGTGSDVGKSIVTTAICRIFRRRGLSVAPFKAQNMSNNSHVTLDGGEMGRAQVVQAEACGIEPHTDMNPVLLKPNTDTGSQVVLQGRAIGNARAAEYFSDTSRIRVPAFESLARLRKNHDLVVIEGAGSCAEVNLRSRDYVNFETARAADAPVVIVADIDRGGVFAQLIGTLEVLPPADRERVVGFIINKFRGDAALFDDGIRFIEERTGLPVLGLIPMFRDIEIDPEDGMPLDTVIDPGTPPQPGRINFGCIRLPHISNFTDFNPLIRHPSVCFHYLAKPRPLRGYDLLFLPGTKNTRFDLKWLRDTGWDARIRDFAGNGGRVFGVCGGYQMLGGAVHDPDGVEGEPGSTPGLGMLEGETILGKDKTLTRARGWLAGTDTRVDGYEIHMGRTTRPDGTAPFAWLETRNREVVSESDGAVSADGRVCGSYLHGLFDAAAFRNHFLRTFDPACGVDDPEQAAGFKQRQYDLLADHFEEHLDVEFLAGCLGIR